jgi:hypothetical protein
MTEDIGTIYLLKNQGNISSSILVNNPWLIGLLFCSFIFPYFVLSLFCTLKDHVLIFIYLLTSTLSVQSLLSWLGGQGIRLQSVSSSSHDRHRPIHRVKL